MTLKEFIDSSISQLGNLYDSSEAKALAFRLVENFIDIPSYKYISEPDMVVSSEPMMRALDELAGGRPLQYVLGWTEFCSHRIRVKEGCLIPRPETEELVYRIADECSGIELGDEPFNILDICTGSGCIAWSLASLFPEAMVYACDISDDALAIACRQKVKLSGPRPVIFKADVLIEPPAGLPMFDIIVSNPPYVRESERVSMRKNVLEYEPAMALFVPDDNPLLFYRAIVKWADILLRPGGRIYLEVNENLADETASLFPGSHICMDINSKKRFVIR